MKTIIAIILASSLAYVAGRTSGKADADLEIYCQGYENAVEELTGGN